MKIWICGSRTVKSYIATEQVLNELIPDTTDVIIRTGGAKGVDKLAEQWARNHGVQIEPAIKPNWKLGPHAGFLRNTDGINWADKVVAIWDGKSKGTQHCIQYAEDTETPLEVHQFE